MSTCIWSFPGPGCGPDWRSRFAARSGTATCGPGTRLPSSRALAADLGIARNTVAEVYSQLVAEGWLTAQTGSGTSVAPRRAPGTGADPPPTVQRRPMPRYDLRAGEPDLSAFPRRAWLAATRKVLAAAPDHLLGYPDPRGVPPLRAALADYLARARGVTADPERTSSSAPASHTGWPPSAVPCARPGASTLAVEAYGHQAHRDIAAGQGLRLRPLPVDAMGAVIGDAAGADAVLLTPAHQSPLGVTLHPRRRREAADWGGVVKVDDYDGEFRYDRQPVGALQTLAPDRVIYAGTASNGSRPAAGLAGRPAAAARRGGRGELAAGPSALDQLDPGRVPHLGRLRPADPPGQARLPAPPGPAGRRPGAARACRSPGSRPACMRSLEFSRTGLERAVVARASQHGVAVDGLERYRAGEDPAAATAGRAW